MTGMKIHLSEGSQNQMGSVIIIFPSLNDGKTQWSRKSFENVADFCHFVA